MDTTANLLPSLTSHLRELGESELQFCTDSSNIDGAVAKKVGQRIRGGLWLLLSFVLHALTIALVWLLAMTIESPIKDDTVILITELQPRSVVATEQKAPPDLQAALAPDNAPDMNPARNDIAVSPEVLAASAEIDQHFEAIDPESTHTDKAFETGELETSDSAQDNTEVAHNGGMDELIGSGGEISRGGGFGGGSGGMGIGTDSAAAGNSFSNRVGNLRRRMVLRYGGSTSTESAVNKALTWLAYHQEPDGSWQIEKNGGSLQNSCCVGVTALATLAFLGAGHTERAGEYKNSVCRAVAWLISQQKETGEIGENQSPAGMRTGSGYNHPIAGLALAESYAMARNPKVKDAAEKALKYTLETYWDSEHKIWHYAPACHYQKDRRIRGENISVVAWFVMQLKSAKVAGLRFDHITYYRHVSDWLDKLMPIGKKDGYPDHRYGYGVGGSASLPKTATTAMGLVCRVFMGTQANELEAGSDFLLNELPRWDSRNGKTDAPRGACPHYYWYYGTLAMFQIGGEAWTKWNDALKTTLVTSQRDDGEYAGSWDLLGSDGPYGGRVYTTALGALSLEVYYRYAQLSAQK